MGIVDILFITFSLLHFARSSQIAPLLPERPMDLGLEALTSASATGRDIYRPEFFRLALPADRERLHELLKRGTTPVVHDELLSQLAELVRALDPAVKFTKPELAKAAKAHLGHASAEEYGVWVYYPWSDRLVHLLDEAEFALVRTDRNRNKITREEQERLGQRRIGVVGLSVGQSICLTLALERGFGELRIADFDTLDLSNLNRIRSGVHSLGHLKTVNVAREIAELDPFLKVTLYNEGLTRDNIDSFLNDGGKLDILVDECDSVDVKILCRQRAKAYRIPVIMDTSDRGLLDVERFDLEPDRPVLHGLVDHLDLKLAAQARTNEEKLPFVIPIIGLETMSTRMKASMLEIESTVTTWPQLGSAVGMGGAVVGHVARRIMLGQPMPSGRWWLDPDDLLGVEEQPLADDRSTRILTDRTADRPSIGLDAMVSAAESLPGSTRGEALSFKESEQLALAGSQAPSGGNCQPWKFLHHNGRLLLFLDTERAHSVLDPGSRYAWLSMGACAENVMLEAARLAIGLHHSFVPLPEVPELIAVFTKDTKTSPREGPRVEVDLAEAIPDRCTNRRFSESLELPSAKAEALIDSVASRFPLTPLTIVRDRAIIDRVAALCGKAERIRFLNNECHRDMFVREMRWSTEQAERTCDGIDVATLELSLADRTGLRVAADPTAMALLRHWGTGNAIEKMTSKMIRASSSLAIISIPDMTLASAYTGGRALERAWLKATALGLTAHPVGAPIFMGIHGMWDDKGILNATEHEEAEAVLNEFKSILGMSGTHPFFMMRLGEAQAPTARSLRYPVRSILNIHQPAHI